MVIWTKMPLAREFNDRFLPQMFRQLHPGDRFVTTEIEVPWRPGIYVSCLKLADGQSEKGNAVMVWGPHAGEIVHLEPTAEVELQKSGSNEAMNVHLEELRIKKKQEIAEARARGE
ncbi:MAG: hypothetical protein Q7R65_00225 [bacterium]|nr:hypothetical protein [bacterium]